jgi:excisionase family DNA binding protein
MSDTSPDPSDDLLGGDRLLTPGEVAALFRVDIRTLGRWTKPGPDGEEPYLPCIRVGRGHRRFRRSDVRALLEGRNDG